MKNKGLSAVMAAILLIGILAGCGSIGSESSTMISEKEETSNSPTQTSNVQGGDTNQGGNSNRTEGSVLKRTEVPDDLTLVTKHVYYEADGSVRRWFEFEYDSFGNQTKELLYAEGGGLSLEKIWDYDDPEYPMVTKYINYDSEGNYSSESKYWYGPSGNMEGAINYYEDGTVRAVSEYDGFGNRIHVTAYKTDGTPEKYTEYDYDDTGTYLLRNAQYDSDGTLKYETVFGCEFDASGRVVKYGTINSDGSLEVQDEYMYDENGNVTVHYKYLWGTMQDWEEKEYDNAGNLIKEMTFDPYYKNMETLREYNDSGNPVKYTEFSSDGNASEWSDYEYDDSGNLLRILQYNADGSSKSWEEYEYIHIGGGGGGK